MQYRKNTYMAKLYSTNKKLKITLVIDFLDKSKIYLEQKKALFDFALCRKKWCKIII